MEMQEPKKHAKALVLKVTAIFLTILVLIRLVIETHEDFSNRFFGFFKGFVHPYALLGMIILFFFSAFFGRKAGEDILIKQQSIFVVAIKYSVLISLIIVAYLTTVAILNRRLYSSTEIGSFISTSFWPMFLRTIPFVFLIWLWAGIRLKRKV